MHLAEEIRGKGLELLRGFHQPVQHGVGGDLKDPGGGANAEPLSQARQYPDAQPHSDLLAMKDGALLSGKKAVAAEAGELPPLAAIGMTIGAQITQPPPAAIATAPMGAEGLRGIRSEERR